MSGVKVTTRSQTRTICVVSKDLAAKVIALHKQPEKEDWQEVLNWNLLLLEQNQR